jgi:hypothetical protein
MQGGYRRSSRRMLPQQRGKQPDQPPDPYVIEFNDDSMIE